MAGRLRWRPVLVVLLAAPLTAELIQAYLGSTGHPGELLFAVVFLAPLYGGAALLIRELCVRTGRGWPARLVLGAAFGLAMTSTVDRSLFTPERPEIEYWGMFTTAAELGDLGLYAPASWITGHVVFSIAVPLALTETVMPAERDRPWLGRWSGTLVALLMVAVAVAVHEDPNASPVVVSPLEQVVSVVAVLALVLLALSPGLRAPAGRARRAPNPWVVGCVGFVAVSLDSLWPSWPGLVLHLSVVAAVWWAVRRWSSGAGWSWRHLGVLAWSALLARCTWSLTNPVPEGVTQAAKLGQNLTFLVLTLLVGVLVLRRTRPVDMPAGVPDTEQA